MGKGLFDNVLSDYLWGVAVLLTTPTVASAVLNVQVPIAMVADGVIKQQAPRASGVAGAALVVVGCIFAATRGPPPPQKRQEEEEEAQGELLQEGGSGT